MYIDNIIVILNLYRDKNVSTNNLIHLKPQQAKSHNTMASTLHTTTLTHLPRHTQPPPRRPPSPRTRHCTPIRSGPRSNRGPLQKGRTLSSESIQAIQTLKRTPTSSSLNTLTRLIKSDLIATIRELLRQNQCTLALHAISALRLEYSASDDVTGLYGEVIAALGRNGMVEEIDRVVEVDLVGGGGIRCGDDKGVGKVLRGVIGAGRRDSTVRILRWMRESGWGGDTWEVDEYLVKLISRGLRSLGERELGDEIWKEFGLKNL